jgi:hypothetical protein
MDIFQSRKAAALRKVLFAGIDPSQGIDEGMSAHHFLRREDFFAGVETGIKNAKIKVFPESVPGSASRNGCDNNRRRSGVRIPATSRNKICP